MRTPMDWEDDHLIVDSADHQTRAAHERQAHPGLGPYDSHQLTERFALMRLSVSGELPDRAQSIAIHP